MKNVLCVAILVVIPASSSAAETELASLPRPLELAGLHAYSDKILRAGETIHFRVSSAVPYELSVCRLGHKSGRPGGR